MLADEPGDRKRRDDVGKWKYFFEKVEDSPNQAQPAAKKFGKYQRRHRCPNNISKFRQEGKYKTGHSYKIQENTNTQVGEIELFCFHSAEISKQNYIKNKQTAFSQLSRDGKVGGDTDLGEGSAAAALYFPDFPTFILPGMLDV